MIRHARIGDLPAIVAMGERFYSISPWGDIAAFDPESFAASVRAMISGAMESTMFVAEFDGRIVGMAGLSCLPLYVNHAVNVAYEQFLFADENHAGAGAALIEALEAAALVRGASALILASLCGVRDPAVARLYRMRGFLPTENVFVKRLKP